jgi:hypothetical protein
MCVKTIFSVFDPWGTKTTSEKMVRLEESAASTRSPTLTSEMGFVSPDSSVTDSEPAKQAFLTNFSVVGELVFCLNPLISPQKPFEFDNVLDGFPEH